MAASRGNARGGARWVLAAAVAFAFAALDYAFTDPLLTAALVHPDFGLDASGQLAFSVALERGLRFGRDVVFTNGPLGFLTAAVKSPGVVPAFVAWAVVECATATALALGIARQSGVKWWVFVPAFCAVSALTPSFEARVYGLAVLLVLHHALCDERGWRPARFVGAAMLGSAALAKFTVAPMALAVGGALALGDLGRRSAVGLTLLATLALAPVAVWTAIYGSPAGLGEFLATSLEISRCYSGALQASGPALELGAFLALAPALLAVIAMTSPGSLPTRLAHAAALAAVLFVAFKHGFVRHDAHARVAWATVLYLLGLALPALIARSRGARRAAAVLLLVAGGGLYVWAQGLHDAAPAARLLASVEGLPEHARRAVRMLRGTAATEMRAEWDGALARVAAANPMPARSGSADLYPFDLRILFAHGVSWNPRPVLQSYQACSVALLERNAVHLREAGADTVLLRVATIDGRLPTLDDGLSWLVLLERYALAGRAGDYIVLERLDDARALRRAPVLRREARFDEPVELSAGEHAALWASLEIRPTLLGRLVALLYKPPPLELALTLESGAEVRYRVVPEMAQAGFLLSPVVADTEALAAFFADHDGAALPKVRAIRLLGDAPGQRWLFAEPFAVTVEAIERSRLPRRGLRSETRDSPTP